MNKQIEEMANILCEAKEHNCNGGNDCLCIKQATALYNAGYKQPINDDEVVVKKAQFESLVNEYKGLTIKYDRVVDELRLCKDANETIKQNYIIVKQETAREILDKVSKKFGGSWLVELYKEYGVEVE